MKHEDLIIQAYDLSPYGNMSCGLVAKGVTITHSPTGISAKCDCQRSQEQNARVALSMIEWGLAEINWKEKS